MGNLSEQLKRVVLQEKLGVIASLDHDECTHNRLSGRFIVCHKKFYPKCNCHMYGNYIIIERDSL